MNAISREAARASDFGSEGRGFESLPARHIAVAFRRLGGVPRRVRYDNLKAAVVRVLAGRDRVESDRFTALRSHYGRVYSSTIVSKRSFRPSAVRSNTKS